MLKGFLSTASVLPTLLCGGCVIAVATLPMVAISEADKRSYLDTIGYFSGPGSVTLSDGTYLQALSLNDERQKAWPQYLICVEAKSAAVSQGDAIELDLRQVRLRRQSGESVKPNRFTVREYRCPGRASSTPRDFEALLRDPLRPLVESYVTLDGSPGTPWLQTLVLSFDQPPPRADEKFTLELGRYKVDGKEMPVPSIEYSRCHARLGCDDGVAKQTGNL